MASTFVTVFYCLISMYTSVWLYLTLGAYGICGRTLSNLTACDEAPSTANSNQ